MFSGPKECQHFLQKWVPEWCHLENFTCMYPPNNSPSAKIQNRQPQWILCLAAALLRSSPCSTLLMVSLFLWSPIWDFHLVKSRLKTGVPFSPEPDAPRSSLFASLPFHTNTLSPGGYMQCTYAQKILSRALSFLPPAPPLVGPHNLVSQHLRFHPSFHVRRRAGLYPANP